MSITPKSGLASDGLRSFLAAARSVFVLAALLVVTSSGAVPARQRDGARQPATRAQALRDFEDYGKVVADLEELCSSVMETNGKLAALLKQPREMNQSSSAQYLTLQQRMQDESRRFSLLANIMKTKHDTARNSINNLR